MGNLITKLEKKGREKEKKPELLNVKAKSDFNTLLICISSSQFDWKYYNYLV